LRNKPLLLKNNSCKSGLNEQCKCIISTYTSKPFLWCFGRPIWHLFAFSTKALNIHNSRTSATPKVEVHLGIIGLHPLHSPPFVKVCFTPKHTLGLIGPCTSDLVTNPMLGLQQKQFHMKLSQRLCIWHDNVHVPIGIYHIGCVHMGKDHAIHIIAFRCLITYIS